MTEKIKPFYECPHCYKKLTTQKRLDKHSCESKKRYDFLKTTKGRGALYCYQQWFAHMRRGKPDAEAFMNSKYYNAINDFIRFCASVGIPDRSKYIKFMVEKDNLPPSWCNTDFYNEFIIHFDETTSPEEISSISINTIYDLADLFECEINEVLSHMRVSDLLRLVNARKLSPWILLPSKSFVDFVKYDTNKEQRILIETIINRKEWMEKFKKNPNTLKIMQKVVKDMDF